MLSVCSPLKNQCMVLGMVCYNHRPIRRNYSGGVLRCGPLQNNLTSCVVDVHVCIAWNSFVMHGVTS